MPDGMLVGKGRGGVPAKVRARARARSKAESRKARLEATVTAAMAPGVPEHRRPILPDPCPPDGGRAARMRMLAFTLISREIAATRSRKEEEARMRVARIALAHERDEPGEADRGPSGLAMKARGATVETVEADVQREDGTLEFQRNAVARVRDGVMEHYVQAGILWGRRLDAMTMLAALYTAARITPGTGRAFGVRAHGQMTDAQAMAWSDWCRACDHVERRSRETVEEVARGRFPCRQNAATELRDGAWDLAEFWRLPPDKRAGA